VALQVADLLDISVVDQAHVMRKLVIDGSNTSGFQRSILLGQAGEIETSEGRVSIADLMLEESAAKREETTEGRRLLARPARRSPRRDRNGAGHPEPEGAREAAERIGMLLRSTGAVKRGLGTIRQDVNVSIADGARVEV